MSGSNPRKRSAPGSAPNILPVSAAPPPPFSPSPQDQLLRWQNNMDPAAFNDVARNANAFMMGATPASYLQQAQQLLPQQTVAQAPSSQPPPPSQQTSTAIARRPPNRALIPSAPRPTYDATADAWAGFGDDGSGNANGGLPGESESIDVLEERAQRVKKEAQAKRKPIPPFVQKLSSFLEEQKNTDLIRWSESGDSFIVLDEDEFAKTLIPELFKHNNYASFVRQLNMYGFHKRVGLSDNSMKASERKNKSPSEYSNPYFKRGHPNLLWLINKPKSGSKSKKGKKDDGDGDSEEDIMGGLDEPQIHAHGLQSMGSQPGRAGAGAGYGTPAGELGPLQRKDIQLIKDDLSTLQARQAQISKVMQRLVSDNAQLQSQARMFQTMHERHENSINAILNFLANVFRKSLEEQGGVQSVTELLASILPNGQMPQGSVVDVSDDFDQQRNPVATNIPMPTPHKRQRLLPPIPGQAPVAAVSMPPTASMSAASSASTSASSGRASSMQPSTTAPTPNIHTEPMGSVTELFDTPSDLGSSNYLQQELQANPQEGMMKIIHDTNANTPTSAAGIDLPEVAAATPVNLSSDQRNRVLSIMSGQNHGNGAAMAGLGGVAGGVASPPPPPPTLADHYGHALAGGGMPTTTSTMPVASSAGVDTSYGGLSLGTSLPASAAATSLSPILSQMPVVPPPPSLQDISNTQAEIDALQRLQEEQNAKITDLSQLLGPLSPSGRIPGIDEDGTVLGSGGGGNGGVSGGQSPGYFDLGQYLDPTAFGEDFNFATGDLGSGGGGGGGTTASTAAGTAAGTTTGGGGAGHAIVDDDDFNFGLGTSMKHEAPLATESASPTGTEEIPRTEMSNGINHEVAKRRRVS